MLFPGTNKGFEKRLELFPKEVVEHVQFYFPAENEKQLVKDFILNDDKQKADKEANE